MTNTNMYFMFAIVIGIQFFWYYSTLPGSLLLKNKKHPKPTIKVALTSYLTYVVPMFIVIYFNLRNNNTQCNAVKSYVALYC